MCFPFCLHTEGSLRLKYYSTDEDVSKKVQVLLRMKGMWFEWAPSLSGPVPLLTKERCLVVTTLLVVKAHHAQAKEVETWAWVGGTQ